VGGVFAAGMLGKLKEVNLTNATLGVLVGAESEEANLTGALADRVTSYSVRTSLMLFSKKQS